MSEVPSPSLNVLPGRILVRVEEDQPEEQATGLIMPGQKKDMPRRATVLNAAYLLMSGEPNPLGIGDTVYISAFGGTELEHAGDKMLVIDERDVLAISEIPR